jgi:hypothetical protein
VNETQVGRFYTAARKFKQLIGVFPDGTQIWGGPYSVTQVVVAVLAAGAGFGSRALGFWGGNFLGDSALIIVIAAGVGFGVGKLPVSRRSLIHMSTSVTDLLMVDPGGYWRGKPVPSHLVKAKPARQAKPKPHSGPRAAGTSPTQAAAIQQSKVADAVNASTGGGLARIRAVTTATTK